MANCCMTDIAIYIDECTEAPEALAQLANLQGKLKEIWKGPDSKFIWEGKVAELFGIPVAGSNCRGEIYGITFEDSYIFICQDDAWCPKVDFWNQILSRDYPDLCLCYIAEEPGCEIYINTDPTGNFFPDAFSVSYWSEGGSRYGEEGSFRYMSDKEMLEDWETRTGRKFDSVEALRAFAAEASDGENSYIVIHEFTCE